MYFDSSHRAQTARTSICAESGTSPPEKAPNSAQTAFFGSISVQKVRFGGFLELAETPLFAQIDVLAVWALWLESRYTRFSSIPLLHGSRLGKGT